MLQNTPRGVLYALFLLSGATGLVYELVWTRELIFVFGGTTYAITTVLVAFMGGLGLGSYISGKLSRRLAQPGVLYGFIEVCIGIYALLVPLLLGLMDPLYRAIYPHVHDAPAVLTGVRFMLSAIIMLIPATMMGATLPVLVRHVTLGGGSSGRSIGILYGINTFGAVFGTAATGFVLIPMLGLSTTTWSAAIVNIVIGIIAIALLRVDRERGEQIRRADMARRGSRETAPTNIPRHVRTILLIVFAFSGFTAMVYQIAWTRALIMSIGSSTYSFTCILAAFILGLALGSLLIARWVDSMRNPVLVTGIFQLAIALSAVIVLPIYGRIPLVVHELVMRYQQNYDLLLALEFLLVIAVTFVPTLLMGALFPLVARANASHEEEAGEATGKIYAVNTIGTVAGAFLGGFLLIRSDVLGVQSTITLAALVNALGGALLIWLTRPVGENLARRVVPAAVAVGLVPLIVGTTGRWDMNLLNSAAFLGRSQDILTEADKWELVSVAEGVDLTVIVTKSKQNPDALTMSVNSKVDASTNVADMVNFLLTGHVPALLNTDGKSVCVVGLGSGLTLGAITRYPGYEHIDSVELSEEVIDAARDHFAPYTHDIFEDERIEHIRADGRNHLLLTDRKYDLIVSQPSNPWIAGVSNLFTREYFQLARDRLTPGGVFCAWLQGYTMSESNVKLVIRTLLEVFPHVTLWEMGEYNYGMIASDQPLTRPLDALLERFNTPEVRADCYRIGMGRIESILGRFLASTENLREWAGPGVLHTDDNAIMEFSAPRHLYNDEEVQIMTSLLRVQESPFESVIVASGSDARHAQIQGRTASIIESRKERIRAFALRTERPYEGIKHLVRAYRHNPADIKVYEALMNVNRSMPRTHVFFTESEEGVAIRKVLDNLREPTLAHVRGWPLRRIAGYLRSKANRVAQDGQKWEIAADYLMEADELAPDDGDILLDLAAALVRAGRMDEALQRLEAGLSSGRTTAAAVSGYVYLRPLHDNPEYQAMLSRHGG